MRRVPLRPTMTLDDAVVAATGAAGEAAIAADGQRATLRELRPRALRLAARLHAAGVEPGDGVALLLPNSVRYVEALTAVVALGAVVVPLDHQLPAAGLAEVAGAVPLRATVGEVPRPAPGRVDVVTDDAGHQGADQGADQGTHDGWRVPSSGAATPAPGALPPAGGRRREDVAAVFLTSGTTGAPKPVPLTHHELVRPLVALQRLHEAFFAGSPVDRVRRFATVGARHGTKLLGAAGRQTWLTTSPFRSMAGHQVLTGSLLLGHHLVTARGFSPRRTLELVDAHRVNVLAGAPAMLELLLRVEDLSPYDLSSLLVIGLGGGPAAPDLVDRGRERFRCAVTVGYGSTELGGGVLATRLEDSLDAQARTVGRPFPGAEVRVVDAAGADLPPGGAGELLCRREGSPDGAWLRTGDLAVLDADGNVAVLGRADDLIVRGGHNVHPLEVERVVEALPGVERCAVVGVPSRSDQQVWAFVVVREGQGVDQDAVRRRCREVLAPAKHPDKVRLVAELPVTEQGEVRRRVLRERALAEARAGGGTGRSAT